MDHLLDTWAFKTLIRPLLDVAVLTFLLYKGYRILYQTRAIPLLRGIILMVLIYALAVGLKLDTLTWILNFVAPGIFVGLAIVFQPELRKIFTQIGQGGWFTPQAKPKAQHVDAVLASCDLLVVVGTSGTVCDRHENRTIEVAVGRAWTRVPHCSWRCRNCSVRTSAFEPSAASSAPSASSSATSAACPSAMPSWR